MARNLEEILRDFDAIVNSRAAQTQQRVGELKLDEEADTRELEGIRDERFRGIADEANQRGIFFSGFQPFEQARFTGGTFLPELARIRSRTRERRFALEDALQQVRDAVLEKAIGIRESDLAAERARKASSGGFGGLGGLLSLFQGGAPGAEPPKPVDTRTDYQQSLRNLESGLKAGSAPDFGAALRALLQEYSKRGIPANEIDAAVKRLYNQFQPIKPAGSAFTALQAFGQKFAPQGRVRDTKLFRTLSGAF